MEYQSAVQRSVILSFGVRSIAGNIGSKIICSLHVSNIGVLGTLSDTIPITRDYDNG